MNIKAAVLAYREHVKSRGIHGYSITEINLRCNCADPPRSCDNRPSHIIVMRGRGERVTFHLACEDHIERAGRIIAEAGVADLRVHPRHHWRGVCPPIRGAA